MGVFLHLKITNNMVNFPIFQYFPQFYNSAASIGLFYEFYEFEHLKIKYFDVYEKISAIYEAFR